MRPRIRATSGGDHEIVDAFWLGRVGPVALVALTAVRVPLAVGLVDWGLGVEAIWLAIAATTVVKGVVLGGLFAAKAGRGRDALDRA